MKKILAVILTLTMLLSLAMPASAGLFKKEATDFRIPRSMFLCPASSVNHTWFHRFDKACELVMSLPELAKSYFLGNEASGQRF